MMKYALRINRFMYKLTAARETKQTNERLKMKTNQKATAIPATIHNLRCGQSVAGVAARPYLESVESDLRRLESEHAALVAVAEAAESHQNSKPGDEMKNWKAIQVALANLAAVREGGAK